MRESYTYKMFKVLKYNDYTIRKVNADYLGRYPREGKDVDIHYCNQGSGKQYITFPKHLISSLEGGGDTQLHTHKIPAQFLNVPGLNIIIFICRIIVV